ncbi:MAG TPA: pyridoxine 5'-phosphate synthase [Candidatus Limnocylindrales bacterium]|nr:pyridoxine 5'-phosphate synthase [Candidatus Limnocylindrales bacterium]
MRRRLGVNIDHVATLRQARGGAAPEPATAAGIAEHHGADGITVHLREDRRHIQDRDLELLAKVVQTRINLEMAATAEMIGIATRLKPYSATIVPEKRQELTTEGGLDVMGQRETLHDVVSRLHDAGILVSLFIDPDLAQVRASRQAGADAVEIHTGTYCEAFRTGTPAGLFKNVPGYEEELEKIRVAAAYGKNIGLQVYAGHGLDVRNIVPILSLPEIEEFNIGPSIIARAVFIGLGAAVREMADLIHGAP